eukprot:m.286555 g.286555  ORF g.286555 m.286555 type:complete len:1364 (+) comp15780_c4_seq11:35-4126(+)
MSRTGLLLVVVVLLLPRLRNAFAAVHGEVEDRLDLTVCLAGHATLKINRTTAWFEYIDRASWLYIAHTTTVRNQRAVGWAHVCAFDHSLIANNQTWKPFGEEQPKSFEKSTPFSVNFTQRGLESGLSIVRDDWLQGDYIPCHSDTNCPGVLRARVMEQPLPSNRFTATIELVNSRNYAGVIHTIQIVPWSVPLPKFDSLTMEGSAISMQPGLDPSPRCTDQPCMLLSPSHIASCACACYTDGGMNSSEVLVDCSASLIKRAINVTLLPTNTVDLVINRLEEVTHWDCGHFSLLTKLSHLFFDTPPFVKACLYDGIRDTLTYLYHRNTKKDYIVLVEPDAFNNLPQLISLDLYVSPSITPHVLSDTTFRGTPKLRSFLAGFAAINWIPSSFFPSMPLLGKVDTYGSLVRYIPKDPFANNPLLTDVLLDFHCNRDARNFSCVCSQVSAVPTNRSMCESMCSLELVGDISPLPKQLTPVKLASVFESDTFRLNPGHTVNVSSGLLSAEFECEGIRGVSTWQPTRRTLRDRCAVLTVIDSLGVARTSYVCNRLLLNPQHNAFTVPKVVAKQVTSLVLKAPEGLRFLTRNLLVSVASRLEHLKVQDVTFTQPPQANTFAASHIRSLELINTNLSPAMLNSSQLWYFLSNHLQHLDLSYSPVSPLPPTLLASLANLSILSLASTGITSLSDVLTPTTNQSEVVSHSLSTLNLTSNALQPFQVEDLLLAFPNLTTLSVSGYIDPTSPTTALMPRFPLLFAEPTNLSHIQVSTLDFHNVRQLVDLHRFTALREVRVTNSRFVPFSLFKGDLPPTVTRLIIDAVALNYIEQGALHDMLFNSSHSGSTQYVVSINTRKGKLGASASSISCTLEGCSCFGTRVYTSQVGCIARCGALQTAGSKCAYPEVCEVECASSPADQPGTALLTCDAESKTFVSTCAPDTASKSGGRLVAGVIVALVVGVAVALLLVARRRRSESMVRSAQQLQHKVDELLLSRFPQLKGQALVMPPLFQLSSLRVEEQLGNGHFSRVSRAVTLAHGAVGPLAAGTTVALKTTDGDAMSLTAALLEAQLMCTYSHPNIVGVVATSLESGACHLALELMDESLLSYVRALQTPLPDSTVASMMLDVAKACEHVASCNIVHRDLSARNCGILHRGKGLTPKAKLFDFGLARVCNDGGVYTSSTQQQAQPIAWMAPESLTDEVFSERSDVWGFGVLCWEINSMGARPWSQFMVQEIVVAVSKQGKHLERPGTLQVPGRCSDRIWDILCQCWQQNAHHRPPFLELVRLISTFSSAPLTAATSVPYNSQTSPCLSEVSTSLDEESAALRSATTSAVAPLGNWCQPEQVQEPSFHQTNQLFHFVLDQRRDDSEVHL